MGVLILAVASPLEEERIRYVKSSLDMLSDRLRDRPGVEAVELATSLSEVREALERVGGRVDAAAVVVLSGGTDRMIYETVRRLGKPVLVYAQPLHNSLASVREAVAALRSEGLDVKVDYGDLKEAPDRLEDFVSAVNAYSRLRGSRVGLVGRPEPWLLIRRDSGLVRDRLGVELVEVDWNEMLEEARAVDGAEVSGVVDKLYSMFGRVEVPRGDLEKAVRLYLAMKRLAEKYGLDAMAVEARDMLREELRDWGPYLGVALISDDGVTADYEVDVDAIITKLIFTLISGRQSFMANITRIDTSENTLVFSHCTIPPSMIDTKSSVLTTYFETDKTVAIKGKMPEGIKVTFARIGGSRLDKIMIGTGEIINGFLDDPSLCRTQALVRVNGNPLKTLEYTLGNHTILAYGDLSRKLEYFAWIAGLETLRIS
ncbi:MAG: hypothetical protein GSR85_00225 [Desulfurococcales archaeon]|nr:hypothetical protein [Desulfurococcales archaeon]